MSLPNGSGRMTLGVKEVIYAQDGENGTTTIVLIKRELLSSIPHTDVVSDGKGGYLGSNPSPAQPVPPDYNYQGPAGTGLA